MFFNYLQKNVNTQKSIIPSCTKSFFTKGLLGGDIFLILLFSFDLIFFKFKMMREGTTLRVDAKASMATFGHIGKQACRCDTHLLTLAKAARSPPCTLPFPGRRSFSFNDK